MLIRCPTTHQLVSELMIYLVAIDRRENNDYTFAVSVCVCVQLYMLYQAGDNSSPLLQTITHLLHYIFLKQTRGALVLGSGCKQGSTIQVQGTSQSEMWQTLFC